MSRLVAQLAEGEATLGGVAFRKRTGGVEKHIQVPHRMTGQSAQHLSGSLLLTATKGKLMVFKGIPSAPPPPVGWVSITLLLQGVPFLPSRTPNLAGWKSREPGEREVLVTPVIE